MATMIDKTMTEADRRHGYRFGVDGLMTRAEAAAFLSCTVRTINNLMAARRIRYRKDGGDPKDTGSRVRICKRSVLVYASEGEC